MMEGRPVKAEEANAVSFEAVEVVSGAEPVPSYASRPPADRHRDRSSRSWGSRKGGSSHSAYPHVHHEAPYTIPSGAPVIQVPDHTSISLSQLVLLDLVATAVSKGGPTVEEEIARREENNPHFEFLQTAWDDERMLYYRWRLYSLLQGDTLMQWRTGPFQMEKGSCALVWIPPRAILSGVESLQFGDGSGTAPSTPPPSAVWLARKVTADRQLFEAMAADDLNAWISLLRLDGATPPLTFLGPTSNAADVEKTWETWTESWMGSVFRSEVIADRMVFAVEHSRTAYHVLSVLLDEVVLLAFRSRQRHVARHREASSASPSCSSTLSECTHAASDSLRCLWYLFVLHDILMNAFEQPLGDEEVALRIREEQENAVRKPSRPAPPSVSDMLLLLPPVKPDVRKSNATSSAHTIQRKQCHTRWSLAAEEILSPLVEAVFMMVMDTVESTGEVRTQMVMNGLAAALQSEVSQSDEDRAVDVQYCFQVKDAACDSLHLEGRGLQEEERQLVRVAKKCSLEVSFLTLSWMKQLFHEWGKPQKGRRSVLSPRMYAKLADKYSFLKL